MNYLPIPYPSASRLDKSYTLIVSALNPKYCADVISSKGNERQVTRYNNSVYINALCYYSEYRCHDEMAAIDFKQSLGIGSKNG